MISPILTYTTEVWGTLLSQISIPVTPLQSKGAHLQFCKPYFEVHNKALSLANRSKLGKYPMIIHTNTKILNSLSYLQDKDARQFSGETISTNIN